MLIIDKIQESNNIYNSIRALQGSLSRQTPLNNETVEGILKKLDWKEILIRRIGK